MVPRGMDPVTLVGRALTGVLRSSDRESSSFGDLEGGLRKRIKESLQHGAGAAACVGLLL